MALIKLESIAHSYYPNPEKDEDYALKSLDVDWSDGGAYALLGPSGCGKTTLLNIISGLLTPSNGRVLYDGKDVTSLSPEQRNIAQVFQFPVLYDTMTVFDNLAFPLRNRRAAKKIVDQRVLEIATMLDLEHDLKKKASGLSPDAKQKISLGRGLVRDDVAAILFDEPLTVIDPQLKWDLRRKLKEVHHRMKRTLVYVTHDQIEAMTFAEKVVVMYNGSVVQMGTPQELFENPAHTFVGYFIGNPGMNFFDCHIDGKDAVIGKNRISLSHDLLGRVKKAEGDLKFGIRPLYLDLSSTPCDNCIKVEIASVNNLGAYKIVTAKMDKSMVKINVPEDKEVPETKGWLHFPKEWIRIYSNEYLV